MKDFVLWRHYLRMTLKIRVADHLVYWQNAIWRRGEIITVKHWEDIF